ncbi:glycosyltransferase family 61 protein [Gymnodinialimonas ceratoperidinii]|uniref:Glycosyltransferase family 61 protein n=1 Tax=Gymnodinialimonas ceratoperidinii TaxID=2856823 RepID=A0A8F6TZY6_9RHOB|nr:glycosyltransferase family 61 protein [Gymnodinialimonas ceratoperidinii]QXT40832.1 glycosyltransferase family 61 protein [Gymnodinialimonas ceratoperidinii]
MTESDGDTLVPPSLDFDPDRPIDWTPTWHRNVTSYPWAENEPRGYRRAAGMFDENGLHLPGSHCWRYADEPMTLIPERDDTDAPFELVKGKWLFAGMFYAHFGHFLVETTQRLYALAQDTGADGIFFYPKMHLTHEHKPYRALKSVFEHLGLGDLPVRLPQRPVQIEQIAFPPPAFGIGEMSAGRPEYRDFMRDRLTRDTPPNGARDVYVSRSGLTSRRGRIVLEQHLERLLEAEGYRIFHPQEHSLAEQVAQYRAARRIVALDGSALHLTAMVAAPDTKIAIINRGPSANVEDYIRQFRAFAQIDPTRIEAIKGCWHPAGTRFVKREVQAHLDFPTAAGQLAEAGFITNPDVWADPADADLTEALQALSASFDAELLYRDLR